MKPLSSCSLTAAMIPALLPGCSPICRLCKFGLSPHIRTPILTIIRLLALPPVPALLALSVEDTLPSLHRYIEELQKEVVTRLPPTPLPTELVAHATTSVQPLTQHNAHVLTRLCHSIRELEESASTDGGRTRLLEHLGPTVTKDIVDFWKDEWVVN
jgi:hypothetical protein